MRTPVVIVSTRDTRCVITVYRFEDGYDISHEADEELVGLGERLLVGDPEAKKMWEPFKDYWPEILDIPKGGYDDGDEELESLGVLDRIGGEPDSWPGQSYFWHKAMSLRLPDVGEVGGGSPASGVLYRILSTESLEKVVDALQDEFRFVLDTSVGAPPVPEGQVRWN